MEHDERQLGRWAEGLRQATSVFEWLLAFTIFLGVVRFSWNSLVVLNGMDWALSDTIYEMIYRVLVVVIGLELIRTLLTHELHAVLELLAFVVARKTLNPDLKVEEILLSVIAFVILLLGRRFLLGPQPEASKPPTGVPVAGITPENKAVGPPPGG